MKKGRGRPTLLETQGEENIKVYVHIPKSIYDAIKEYGVALSPAESVPAVLSKMARKKYDKKFIEKYIKELKILIDNDDTEFAHGEADDILCKILCELGLSKIVDLYEKVKKWYA